MMSAEIIPAPSLHVERSLVAACVGDVRSLFCFVGLGESGSCLAALLSFIMFVWILFF